MSFNGDLNAGDAGEDLTTKGDLHGFDTENTRIPVGADGTVLTADSTAALGLAYSTSAANVLTTQGDVLYHNASGLARLAAGISGQSLQTQGAGANPIWVSAAGGSVEPDEVVNDYSTTLADYNETITTATASSATSAPYSYSTGGGSTTDKDLDGYYLTRGFTATAGFSGIGATITSIKFKMKWSASGSPSGLVEVGISTGGCQPADITTSYGTVDANSLTGSYVEHTFTGGSAVLGVDDRIMASFPSGNGTNKVWLASDYGGTPADTTMFYSRSSPTNCQTDSSLNIFCELAGTQSNSADKAIDGSTATFWESTAAANNWLQLDLAAPQDVTAMTIYLDTTATTETQFLLQSSDDAISWNDLRTINVSALTDAAYNYIRFMSTNDRYFRIYGNSGASSVMKINEVALQPVSISSHGHLSIDPTDATLALDGT